MIIDTLAVSGNLSSSELEKTMGYAKVTASVGKAIKELIEEGKIVYYDPKRHRSHNQKISLVENTSEG